MSRSPDYLSFHAAAAAALGAAALLAIAARGQEATPLEPLSPEEKKEEKPKEPPLKYSAWCAFRDLTDTRPPPKEDPTIDETRLAARRWAGFARRGQWAHVILEIRNTTEKSEYKGTATIQFNPVRENERGITPYQTYYRQEFEIGPQTTKQYSFSILCPEEGWNNAVEVGIAASGRPPVARLVTLHDLDAFRQDFIVVVSETAGAFRHLATKKSQNIEDEDQRRLRMVAVVEPSELPSRWHDLMLANLIVIDGPPREQLTDTQWAALKSYVQAGGHVLITAGKDPSRLKGAVEELAGITVRGMMETDSLNGGASSDLHWAPKDPTWRLPMADVSVSPKGNPVVEYNQTTRKVEKCTRFYGPGSVVFLPYSLSDPRLENWAGRMLIPNGIIEYGRGRRLFGHTPVDEELVGITPQGMGEARGIGALRATSLMGLRHTLDESFVHDTPVKPQEKGIVLSFLLFYLLCAVPGNYLLFGWLKRREVAWLTVPAWAATFSVMAWMVGYMGQTGQLTVNEVAVIEAGSGQDMGISRTFVGVYAPRRDEYRVEFPLLKGVSDDVFDMQAGPCHLINLSRGESRGLDIPPLSLVETGQGLVIERLLVQQRSTRQLEVVHRARIGGGVDVNVRPTRNAPSDAKDAPLDVEVTNNTGVALYYPVLVREGKAFELGTVEGNVLPPGGNRKLSAIGASSEGALDPAKAFFGKMVVLPSARGPGARNRALALNEFVRTQADKYPHGVVCAWMDNPTGVLPVKVGVGRAEAKEPKIEGLSLLLIPVTVKTDLASGELPGGLRVSCSSDYDLGTDQGQWRPGFSSIAMNRSAATPVNPYPNRNNPNTSEAVAAFLKVDLPANYRVLNYAGLQCLLQFKADVKFPGGGVPRPRQGQQPAAPVLDGDLKVEVRRQLDNGQVRWDEIDSRLTPRLSPGKPYKSSVALPWSDYHALSNKAILVRVSFVPNAARSGVSYTLQLQDVECNARRP